MKVFVTGATGFTGSRTIPHLLGCGFTLRCLYRDPARIDDLPLEGIEWVPGDLADPTGLARSMQGCDALANLASLGFGHAPGILQAAHAAGIQRAVFISTTAIFTRLNARSKLVRLAAEDAVRTSGLAWTLLRPTMIYGSPRDRNMWRLVRWLRILPVLPVIGDGLHLQQPVFVDDVAWAVAAVLQNDRTVDRAYNIAGKQAQPYNQIIDTVAGLLARRVWKIHIPAAPAVALLRGLEWLRLPIPLKSEQVERLNEDKAFDYSEAAADFGYTPRSFKDGMRQELTYIPS
jgi:nucleoside-diphosphate-sugar epimerase